MDISSPYKLYKLLEKDKFTFAYQGDFTDEMTPDLLRVNENQVETEQSDTPKIKNRLSFLIAECFQNIIRHGDKPEIVHKTNNKPDMFLTRNINNDYYISSANLIDNDKVDPLKKKLGNLRNLTKEELKALSLQSLAQTTLSSKGGAGLGLIEIARKSDQQIDYEFEWVNFYLSLFFVQVKLNVTKADEKSHEHLAISDMKSIYNLLFEENLIIIYKEDFSQKNIIPVLSMVESNLKQEDKDITSRKRVLYLLIEMLQNVAKHSKSLNGNQNGIFLMSKIKDNYVIASGNYIDKEKAEIVEKRLNHINSIGRDGLKELYRQTLIENKENHHSGLGFIEMGRYSKDKLLYSFEPVDNLTSFFTLLLTI